VCIILFKIELLIGVNILNYGKDVKL